MGEALPSSARSVRATVMFASLVGYTGLSAALGPERAYLIVTGCLRGLDAIARRHGGAVDKYLGDSLMVVFGHPLPLANAARAAIAAALEMRQHVRDYHGGLALSLPLDLHVGIASGPLVAGDSRRARGARVPRARRHRERGGASQVEGAPSARSTCPRRRARRPARASPSSRSRRSRSRASRAACAAFEALAERASSRAQQPRRRGRRGAAAGRPRRRAGATAGRGSAGSRRVAAARSRSSARRAAANRGCSPPSRPALGGRRDARRAARGGRARVTARRASPSCWPAPPCADPPAGRGRRGRAAPTPRGVDAADRRGGRGPRARRRRLARRARRAARARRDAPAAVPGHGATAARRRGRGAARAPAHAARRGRRGDRARPARGRRRAPPAHGARRREPALRRMRAACVEARAAGNPARLRAGRPSGPGARRRARPRRERRRALERRRAAPGHDRVRRHHRLHGHDRSGSARRPPTRSWSAACSSSTRSRASHGGTVDKYLGDCVMATFGVPEAIEDAPRAAVNAAIEMRRRVREYNRERALPLPLDLHIGIHTGLGIAGDISGPLLREFAVMGEPVDVADAAHGSRGGRARSSSAATRSASRATSSSSARADRSASRRRIARAIEAFELLSDARAAAPRADRRRAPRLLRAGRARCRARRAARAARRAARGRGAVIVARRRGGPRKVAPRRRAGRERRRRRPWPGARAAPLSTGRNLALPPVRGPAVAPGPASRTRTTRKRRARSSTPSIARRPPGGGRRHLPAARQPAGAAPRRRRARAPGAASPATRSRSWIRSARDAAAARGAAGCAPVVVVMDDLHWADLSSIELLEALLPLADDHPMLFVSVSRPGFAATSGRIARGAPAARRARPRSRSSSHRSRAPPRVSFVNNLFEADGLPARDARADRGEGPGQPVLHRGGGALARRRGRRRVPRRALPRDREDPPRGDPRARSTKWSWRAWTGCRCASGTLLQPASRDRPHLPRERARRRWSSDGTRSRRRAARARGRRVHRALGPDARRRVRVQASADPGGDLRRAARDAARGAAPAGGARHRDECCRAEIAGLRGHARLPLHARAASSSGPRSTCSAPATRRRAPPPRARRCTSSRRLRSSTCELHGDGGDPRKKALLESNVGFALFYRGRLIEADRALRRRALAPRRAAPRGDRELWLRFARNLVAGARRALSPDRAAARRRATVDREVIELLRKRGAGPDHRVAHAHRLRQHGRARAARPGRRATRPERGRHVRRPRSASSPTAASRSRSAAASSSARGGWCDPTTCPIAASTAP